MPPKRGGRLRVIAGEAGGLTLVAPPKARPTTDRVREALFSALGAEVVVGASVLDLYAGSGALAIEALSRGATSGLLVDRDRAAAEACRQNLTTTRLADRARVQVSLVGALLDSDPPAEAPFDLVLCDPPYDTAPAEIESVVEALARPGWLAPGAVVVVEGPARGNPVRPAGWEPFWQRKYGDTLVTALEVVGGPPGAPG